MNGIRLLKKLGLLLYAVAYECCAVTGLFTLGVFQGAGRLFSVRLRALERRTEERAARAGRALRRAAESALDRRRQRRRRSGAAWAAFTAGLRHLAHGRARDGGRLLLRAARGAGRAMLPLLRAAVNVGLPLAALALLARTVLDSGQVRYALRVSAETPAGLVEYGYIQDESVYDQALREVTDKLQGVQDAAQSYPARFVLEPVARETELLDAFSLSDRMIAAGGGDIEEAYGLYIDGELVDAVRDKDALLDLLAALQDRVRTGDPTESVSFVRPVAVREGLYPSGRVAPLSAVRDKIDREVRGEFTYEAQAGDSASAIASRFDVPQSQIVANNPGILERLMVGDEVLISRAEPYLAVKVRRVETYNEVEPFPTEVREDPDLLEGQRETVRDGVPGISRVRAAVTSVGDVEQERRELSRETLVEPVSEIVSVGTKRFLQNYGGGRVSANFIVPVPGARYISNYFNGTSSSPYFHGALDYAANYGTPIYASAPGTVVYSAYTSYGYGHHIIIDHGGGVQTLYAHMSSRVAKVGDVVDQGQVIGYVGSTGMSTGNHCHFEIRLSGAKVDPLRYLG